MSPEAHFTSIRAHRRLYALISETTLERTLKHDRWLTLAALAVVAALCWLWIVPMARDMYGAMNGPAEWMMAGTWEWSRVLLLFAMWQVMMIGMMLPSAAPTLLLYAAVVRKSEPTARAPLRVYAFALGYLAIWTLFSASVTPLQRMLSELSLLSPMLQMQNRWLSAALLIVAGIYQLTAAKRSCLKHCRSPVQFIVDNFRPGATGAFRMGLEHGLYCLGCCWAIMLLLFVGGVMNLWVIGAITLLILFEKLAPLGARSSRLSGALLIVLGLWAFLGPMLLQR
jgi:predicted metal-binding membrane protein